jgi:long-chain acyl-CoA synthetase
MPAVESARMRSNRSTTIADLVERSAERFGGLPAIRRKVDGTWEESSFSEVDAVVGEIALGLIELGIEPGDRVCLLGATRAEWSFCHFAIAGAGAIAVPIYPTNSPEECEWVASDSGAVAIVCEDAGQLAKIATVRERLPDLRTLVVIDAPGDADGAVTLDDVRALGRVRDRSELDARRRAVGPDDTFTIIYTSGTTGPPKGCVLSHGNYRQVLDMCEEVRGLGSEDEIYLFLPLAHSFGLLMQLLSFDVGATLDYFGGDPDQIIAELQELRPTYLPSIPRLFEKIYTLTLGSQPPEAQERMTAAARLGLQVRRMQARGEAVPSQLMAPFERAEKELFARVRAVFGGRLRQAVSGAAPIAPEILEFFYGCGVPVLEGYGMTETATVSASSTLEHHRFGSVGRLLPGVEGRVADDGELLLRGRNVFQGYWSAAAGDADFGAVIDGWLHTGDVASIDEDGYVFITGRKKDIIITAGGKNVAPANLENDVKRSPWISQAVMHGDRRPYPVMLVTLDEASIVPWAHEQGIVDVTMSALAGDPRVRELIQAELDRVNERYARPEQVKAFFILDHDLSQATGELTPTSKVKRGVVAARYADRFAELYEGQRPGGAGRPDARTGASPRLGPGTSRA